MYYRRFVRKLRYFKWYFLIIIMYLIYVIHNVLSDNDKSQEEKSQNNFYVKLPYVVVHLDFKGAPPKLDYLGLVLKKIRYLGANALLIEYEDMFPYEDSIFNLSTPRHYNREELKKFLTLATELNFEVIPLIQTFGHMQFVLKLAEFKHLRENPIRPGSICPSKKESLVLIQKMLKQVIDFHENIAPLKHIHIGCDEVRDLNLCEHCKQRKWSNMDLFFNHVKSVVKIVKRLTPTTTVLIWDDMIRDITPIQWQNIGILNVEPVCWYYEPSPIKMNSYVTYSKVFENIWAASAFKGADGNGMKSFEPDIVSRFINTYYWVSLILDLKLGESKESNFKGIILTGWSRFDHFEPICDPLPISIPSLILNLLLVSLYQDSYENEYPSDSDAIAFKIYNKYIKDDYRRQLECDDIVKLHGQQSMSNFEVCFLNITFPVYFHLRNYIDFINNLKLRFIEDEINEYAQFGLISLYRTTGHEQWCFDARNDLLAQEISLKQHLQYYFHIDVINEYLDYKSYVAHRYFNMCETHLSKLDSPRNWDRGGRK